MTITIVGRGSYTTALPEGELPVTDSGNTPITPLVTANVTGAVPTSDWSSSLSYPFFGDAFSSVMYANPLALKAESTGLEIGYGTSPRFIDGAPSDPAHHGVKYEFTYAPDLTVGLSGLAAPDARLDGYGDWTVRARWDDGGTGLHATFGNGLPFVYFERQGDADAIITFREQNESGIGRPVDPLVYTIDDLTGSYNGGATAFALAVDAGTSLANGPQMRVSYDFDGDGSFERVETFGYFPTDAAVGWESYTEAQGLHSERGAFADFAGGSIRVEIWNAIGQGDITVATDTPASLPSRIEVPFDDLQVAGTVAADGMLFLRGGAVAGGESGALSPQAGVTAGADTTAAPDIGLPGWEGPGSLWYDQGGVAGLTINGAQYGIFGPSGSSWQWTDFGLVSDLGGADYFSLAVLPDNEIGTLLSFREHAYNFVTDSRIDFAYEPATSLVRNIFTVTTEAKETGGGLSDEPLLSLYRHQWLHTDAPLTDHGYISPRGEMKVLAGAGFTTETLASGLLPSLPDKGTYDRARLHQLVDDAWGEVLARPDAFPMQDTYAAGKEMGRLSELVHIANQIGHGEARDHLLGVLKAELEDWFDATDGTAKQFYYNSDWGTLQGYPASFHSETQINDHQFHYGYFVQAAATIAAYDPAWAAPDQWGGMVDLLIADVANADRADAMFPYLRSFDPYSGHSWASGHGAFASGNNQESSSEALNFATGVALWGAATGQDDLRDLGVYLHTIESLAARQYWFDVDGAVFPEDYLYGAVGMIWGDGGDHRTFFSANPEMIHGINFLPVNGGSLYLGYDPAYVAALHDEIVATRGGDPVVWKDLIWEYLALADADAAMAGFLADPGYTPEEGESRAHTYHWIANLQVMGHVERGITADTPFHAVFNKDGMLTYVAYNPGTDERDVTFSDGTVLTLPGRSMAAGDGHGDLTVTHLGTAVTPEPDPQPELDPDPQPEPDPSPEPAPVVGNGLRLADGEVLFSADLGEVAVPWAAGVHSVGTPNDPLVFTLDGLSGAYNGAEAGFVLALDAGTGVGNGTAVRISYDFDGNGTFDRIETYDYFPANDVAGWEYYDARRGLTSEQGAFADFAGGMIKVEIWNAFGSSDVALDTTQSRFLLPFIGLDGGTSPAPDPDPTPNPDPDPAPGAPVLVLDGGVVTFSGSPTLAVVEATDGIHSVGTPWNAHHLVLDNLTGTLEPGQTAQFALGLDAGFSVGNATQMRITYDFKGDGSEVRTETYGYLATNDLPGWETYDATRGLVHAEGVFADFSHGRISIEIWNAFGSGDVAFDLDASWFRFPYANLVDDGTSPDPAPDPTPDQPDGDPVLVTGNRLYLGDGGSLSFEPGAGGAVTMVASAEGGRHFDAPVGAQSFRIDGISGSYRLGEATGFALPLDAGNHVGNGTQARVSYDFDGDGNADRVEAYAFFASNDVFDWESYTAGHGLVSAIGAFEDLVHGSVQIDVWNVIGHGEVALLTDMLEEGQPQAVLVLPYDDMWS